MPDESATKLVVFDFDGTVAIGDAPVQAYLAAIVDGLERAGIPVPPLPGAGGVGSEADGYGAIARWAAVEGVPESIRGAAYAASRSGLHDGAIAVEAPAGLADLLDRRPDDVRCALVTNAPVVGIEPLLARLGLERRFDVLIGDAGKPDGLAPVLEGLLARFEVDGRDLLTVGDVWVNDLAPALPLGAATAYIDRYGRDDGEPTFRAASTADLIADIEGWWSA